MHHDEVSKLNPEDLISGDNGHDQHLTIRRTMTVADPRKRCAMVERLCEDEWGNIYLVYSARLSDGEIYEVADRVRESVQLKYGGFTDALFDDFRSKAFVCFAEAEADNAQARANADSLAAMLLRNQSLNLGGKN